MGVVPFQQINDKEQYFAWLEHTFVPTMFPDFVSPGATNRTHGNHWSSKVSHEMGYRLGAVRVRQLRVEDDSCLVPARFQRAVTRCHSKIYVGNEEIEKKFLGKPWKSEAEMGSGSFYSYLTKQTYSGSGYEFYLDIDENTQDKLRSSTWIDFATRLVSIDFSVYNPSMDIITTGSFVTEFMPSGDVIPSYNIKVFDDWKFLRIWRGDQGEDSSFYYQYLIALEGLMYLFALSYLWEVSFPL